MPIRVFALVLKATALLASGPLLAQTAAAPDANGRKDVAPEPVLLINAPGIERLGKPEQRHPLTASVLHQMLEREEIPQAQLSAPLRRRFTDGRSSTLSMEVSHGVEVFTRFQENSGMNKRLNNGGGTLNGGDRLGPRASAGVRLHY